MSQSATMKTPNGGSTPVSGELVTLLEGVKSRALTAGVFGPVAVDAACGRLTCRAANAAAPAEYRVDVQQGRLWVSLVTADRWLSQSVEADLVHTGDKLDELLAEELVELDFDTRSAAIAFEHFRSEDKLFTFRSPIPVAMNDVGAAGSVETASKWLLAYEACFRRLGDIDAGEGEE